MPPCTSVPNTRHFHLFRSPPWLATILSLAVLVSSCLSALAATPPNGGDSSLANKKFSRPELQVSSANEPLETIRQRTPQARENARSRFTAKHGADFRFHYDPRSGTPSSVVGHIPFIPGKGKNNRIKEVQLSQALGETVTSVDTNTVSRLMKAFMRDNQDLLNLDVTQAGNVRAEKVSDHLWQLQVQQEVNGIKVRGARFAATVNNGNLVLFGTERWGDVAIDTTPKISAETALQLGFQYADGQTPFDRVTTPPTLEILPVAPLQLQDGSRYTGQVGKGYEHRLVWTFTFKRPPEVATWEVMINAQTGEIQSFRDVNQYATAGISGGVYPLTSTEVCPANTCCGVMQADQPLPFADTGQPAPHDFTNSAGLFDYQSGAVTTTLNGKYVRISDTCGIISESAFGSGGLSLGGANGQHDCVSGGSSPGNTASARSAYYELNRIQEVARGYLPGNSWLQQTLITNVNLEQVCNAYWDGATVNFFQSGGGCRNTGEIAGVFDHEWAHGLDWNDGNGPSSPGESYADIAAMYRLKSSCIGYGFFQGSNRGCGKTADNTGYNIDIDQNGSPRCALNCSGVRETDWTQLSGPLSRPDTPANFACSRCPESSGYFGPCGRQAHCESAVDTQAAWDFVARDLQAPPFNYDSNTAFLIASRIFYQAAGSIGDWHTCSCAAAPGETSNGCGATNAYLQWLAVDDDDGDINNGTPHMTALYNAFNRHEIACSTPTPVNSGCAGGPAAPPTVTLTPGNGRVDLSWNSDPAATGGYRIFRTEGAAGCGTGQALIAIVSAATTYGDQNLANDRQYCYAVMATGSSPACFSPTSSCSCVTPTSSAYGVLSGTLSDGISGAPVPRAVVTLPGGYTTATGSDGVYRFDELPAGSYTATITKPGYRTLTVPAITVSNGATTNGDRTLTPLSLVTVQGTVTDGSGHGWHLYARLAIAPAGNAGVADPAAAVTIHTDPLTGGYSLLLYEEATYTVSVSRPGYVPATRQITVPAGGSAENFTLQVDQTSCAPGYGLISLEQFEQSNGGYTITDMSTPDIWGRPGGKPSWDWGVPFGTPNAARSGSKVWGTNLTGFYNNRESSYLTSPAIDLGSRAGQGTILSWWQWLQTELDYDYVRAEVSNDDGSSWAPVYGLVSGPVATSWTNRQVALDPSYSVSNFRVRFLLSSDDYVSFPGWYIDDLSILPQEGCQATAGGLLAGTVRDGSTGMWVNGATISAGTGPATPTALLGNGNYALFLPPGSHTVTVSAPGYITQTLANVMIGADSVTRQDVILLQPLSVATGKLAAFTGSGFSSALSANGGLAPYTWELTSGTLPGGLSLNGATGVVSGTPLAAESAVITVRVTDANTQSSDRTLTVTVHPLVTGHLPGTGAVAPVTAAVRATFSDPMDSATITTDNVTLFTGMSPKAIAAGDYHSMALLTNGTVVAWGENTYGQSTPPDGLSGVAAIAAGDFHSLALKSDGTVVAWGGSAVGLDLNKVPPYLTGTVAIGIAAGAYHNVVLKADGTVVSWGDNTEGTCNVPPGLSGVTAIAAGLVHSVALRSDGTVVAWGDNTYGQSTPPDGLSNVIAIEAGTYNTMALKSDGTVVVWGNGNTGQNAVPAGLDRVVSIRAGGAHALALTRDNAVAAWGYENVGQTVVPVELSVTETQVTGSVTYDAPTRTATFTPTAPLAGMTEYFARIDAPASLTGVPLAAPFSWSFSTEAAIYPSITTIALPKGKVDTPYSKTLAVNGGNLPYTWSVSSGSLPDGLSLGSSTGIISGTPTVADTFTFTLQVSDANLATASKTLSLTVDGPLVLKTFTAPDGHLGEPYTWTFRAGGGTLPYMWLYYYSLPPGLSLDRDTGVLSGTPTVAGSYDFTIQVFDKYSEMVSLPLTFTVIGPLEIDTSYLPAGSVGTAYSQSVAVLYGTAPYTWSVTAGSLPAGLSLDSASGLISGTPLSSGSAQFTLKVTDSVGATASKILTIVVYAQLAISTGSLPEGFTGSAYSHTLAATGGAPPHSWLIIDGSLPPGLFLNNATGTITGTPTAVGSSTFTVQVTDGVLTTASRELTLTISAIFSISTASLPATITGTAYSQTLAAVNGTSPYNWAITDGSLPPGISLGSGTGLLSGTATTAGTYTFSVSVTDSTAATASKQLSIVVSDPLVITTVSLPDGITGSAYNQSVTASGGETPYSWSIVSGSLPAGLTLTAATGAITGTPATAGSSSFSVRVTTANNITLSKTFSLTIVEYIPVYPTVSSHLPAAGAVVGVDAAISATFSEPLDPATVTTADFRLTTGAAPVAIAAGYYHSVALQADGTVTAWGYNTSGQCTIPAGLSDVIAVSAGSYHTVALKGDGTVIAWGQNTYGQTTVPPGLTGVTAISAGAMFTLALKSDGTVVAWGSSSSGQLNIPAGLSGVIAIDAGSFHSLALKRDGTVVAWGNSGAATVPAGLSDVIAVAAGGGQSLALKKDGTVVAWGDNSFGKATVPAGLGNVTAIAAAFNLSMALKSDGTVVAWGNTSYGQSTVPPTLTGAAAIAAGGGHALTLKSDATIVGWGDSRHGEITVPGAYTVTGNAVTGTVSYDAPSQTATFTPAAPLAVATTYVAAISGVATPEGAVLVTPFSWSFTTEAVLSPGITTTSLPDGAIGAAYSQTLAVSGGTAPYSWSLSQGSLPDGLTLDSASGLITGTPATTGLVSFTLRVADSAGAAAYQTLSLTVLSPLLITTATLADGSNGSAYSQTLTASGGTLPYSWSITAGALPAGLTLDSASGTISGVPSASGDFSIAVTVTGSGSPASRTFTLVIKPALIRVPGPTPRFFDLLQEAYNALSNDETLQITAGGFNGNLDCNREVNVTLRGGYTQDYGSIAAETVIRGALTITKGTVTVDGLTLGAP